MPDSPILKSLEDGVLTLTISRPEALNALNRQVIDALAAAIEAAQDNADVRVIVLTGAGEKAFVAGADIKEFADFDRAQGEDLARRGQRNLFDRVEQSRKPVVAAINGFALGGGLELAMAAHVRVASTNARMGLPEVSLGVIPGYGGTQRLAQIVGKGKAMEMVLTGGMIPADDARQCGLVNQVVEPELLLETAQILASKMAKNAPTPWPQLSTACWPVTTEMALPWKSSALASASPPTTSRKARRRFWKSASPTSQDHERRPFCLFRGRPCGGEHAPRVAGLQHA